MRRLLAILFASVLVASMSGTALAASGGQSGDNAMKWYLSLGDSLAAGYQPIGDPANMFRTNHGYAEQLLALARSEYPKLQLAKFGCPGATTESFIGGDVWCPFDEGSQLAQALVFLKAHKDKVAFVTIDIGWNDFQGCDRVPLDQLQACIAAGMASVAAGLQVILPALKAAAPGVPIVGATIYDPFLAFWLGGAQGQALALLSTQIIGQVNAATTVLYGMNGVPVADVQGAFHTFDWTPVSTPLGPLPTNVATICALTWKCTPYQDNHPNATGYGVIAQAFWDELK